MPRSSSIGMEAYAIDRLLGRGAYGQVHLVTRKADGAQLALKRTDFSALEPAEQKATLFEVSLLSRLRHPCVVSLLDHFHEDGELCIVMELAPDDLDKELRRARKAQARFRESRILDVLSQVGRALHFAHGCRVVHRDVKPANVLIAPDGTARLADFGISSSIASGAAHLGRELRQRRLEDGSTVVDEDESPENASTLQGTPFYMAPELFSDALHVDGMMFSPASDVWALGVTVFELLTLGERPYKGESVGAIVYKLMKDLSQNAMADAAARVRREGGYSAELCDCVASMLRKRPRQRATLPGLFASAALVGHARGGAPEPELIDLLEEKAKVLGGRVPDCYAFGHGAAAPRLRHDLMGIAVVHLACGASHCAVVSDGGLLFTWGDNQFGQLGHGDKRPLKTRRAVLFAQGGVHCVGVACGRAHTIVLDATGSLHAFGSDKHGQLGLGRERRDAGADDNDDDDDDDDADAAKASRHDGMGCVLSPAPLGPPPLTEPQPPPPWAMVSCGEKHSAALAATGVAFAWGCAEDGRLGVRLGERGGVDDAIVRAPRRIALDGTAATPAVMLDCGNEFTAIVDDDGYAWGCGANWQGQLGRDSSVEEYPTPVRLLPEVDVGVESLYCGADHMAAIDGAGLLWVWGGRFGETPTCQSLGGGELCALVACGCGTVFAVTDEGAAYSWGEGSGRRLGLGDEGEDHEEPQVMASLSTPRVRVSMAACGKGGSTELDQAPSVLILGLPESGEQLSDQYRRFYAGHWGSQLAHAAAEGGLGGRLGGEAVEEQGAEEEADEDDATAAARVLPILRARVGRALGDIAEETARRSAVPPK